MAAARASRLWAARSVANACLLPVAWLFGLVTLIRRTCYRSGLLRRTRLPVPTIVIGNITVGGSGKTPLVMALLNALKAHGYHPGVLSRGYAGSFSKSAALALVDSSDASRFGDEIVLIRERTGVPCMVGAKRVITGPALLAAHPEIDILVLDDGLQHYALERDIEIAVFDQRGIGNGWLLPAGPLREGTSRLERVDAIVVNGATLDVIDHALAPAVPRFAMRLDHADAVQLIAPEQRRALASFAGRSISACAGIGHPARFFAMLESLGLTVMPYPLADHAPMDQRMIAALPGEIVLITEKDAVKWRAADDARIWVVPVEATIDATFFDLLLGKLHASR